jgi:hypothetical protein
MSLTTEEHLAMSSPSLARDFFDRIVNSADPAAAIRGLVDPANPTVETDWLDFKTEPQDQKQRDRKIREMWSEALGGFANNQGGVLIWGIDARKTQVRGAEIDAACGERPMTDPLALMSRLTELQRGATDPPLANVQLKAYEVADSPGKGFVVCHIPEGPYKPYRSEQASQQYYLRAGDNFIVMSRSVLASMFYPRSQAVFRAVARLAWDLVKSERPGEGQIARFHCSIDLVNVGTATAKDLLVFVKPQIDTNHLPQPPVPLTGLWSIYKLGNDFEFQARRPMHPHRVTPLYGGEWDAGPRDSADHHYRFMPFCRAPSFQLMIFCENQAAQVIKIEFDTAEMHDNPKGCHREVTAEG